jgi:hypothetical protein
VRRPGAWLAAAIGLAACSDDASHEPEAQRMEVGTGDRGRFVAISDGGALSLQRGCQGSQHVFTSVRAWGMTGARLLIRAEIMRVRDGEVVSIPLSLRLPLDELNDVGARQITGLTPVVADPVDVVGEQVELRASVEDESGAIVADARRGVVRWGADSCNPHGAIPSEPLRSWAPQG